MFVFKFVASTKSGVVEVLNLTRTSQGRIGLLIREGEDQKIYVEDVVPGEPAATQGDLRQGDRILEACILTVVNVMVTYEVMLWANDECGDLRSSGYEIQSCCLVAQQQI